MNTNHTPRQTDNRLTNDITHNDTHSNNHNDPIQLDTTGLVCPEPVMLLHQKIRKVDSGDCIEVVATDPATTRDIPNFCRHLGHTLIKQTQTNLTEEAITYHYLIQKT